MKNLPERLLAAASFVERGSVIADVGCDHGLLPHYLLKSGTSDFAYLLDKNRGPLLRAGENTEKYGLSDKCALVLSDGLKKLPEYIEGGQIRAGFPDTVIITGMGGPLILRILDETPWEIRKRADTWILSPQSLIEECREGLRMRGFLILEEKTADDKGKHYVILRCKESSTGVFPDSKGEQNEVPRYIM